MKKLFIAVIIIVVLAAGLSGAAWYTGKQVERKIDTYVAGLNQWLTTNENLQLRYQNYQRGVFSSHFQLVIQPLERELPLAVQPLGLKPLSKPIILNETVYHGPFPLSELAQFHFSPVLAATAIHLSEKKLDLTINSRISYGLDQIASVIKLAPMQFSDDGTNYDLAGGEMKINVFGNISAGKVDSLNTSINLGKSIFTIKSATRQYSIDGFTASSESNKAGNIDLYIGNFKANVNNLSYNVNSVNNLSIANIELTAASVLSKDKKTIDFQQHYKVNDVNFMQQHIGDGELAFDIDSMKLSALMDILELARSSDISVEKLKSQPYASVEKLKSQFESLLYTAFQNPTVIRIEPFSWKTDQGTMSYKLAVSFNDIASLISGRTSPANFQHSVKSLDSHLLIPKLALSRLLNQVNYGLRAEKVQDAQEKTALQQKVSKEVDQQIELFSTMGQQFKLINTDVDKITSDLHYADGKIEFNGQKMTPEAFFSLLRLDH